jgi:hypothetical protein
MFVRVAQLFENGRPLPRHRSITSQPVHVGKFCLFEEHDRSFRRAMVYAKLSHASSGADVIPRLQDAVVRWIGDSCMTVSGFEQDTLTSECRAQSWYIQLVADEVEG